MQMCCSADLSILPASTSGFAVMSLAMAPFLFEGHGPGTPYASPSVMMPARLSSRSIWLLFLNVRRAGAVVGAVAGAVVGAVAGAVIGVVAGADGVVVGAASVGVLVGVASIGVASVGASGGSRLRSMAATMPSVVMAWRSLTLGLGSDSSSLPSTSKGKAESALQHSSARCAAASSASSETTVQLRSELLLALALALPLKLFTTSSHFFTP